MIWNEGIQRFTETHHSTWPCLSFYFYKAGFELIFFTNIRVVALSGLAFILSFRGVFVLSFTTLAHDRVVPLNKIEHYSHAPQLMTLDLPHPHALIPVNFFLNILYLGS